MTEEEGGVGNKSVEDIFKNAFAPTKKEVEKTETKQEESPSEIFKNIFVPGSKIAATESTIAKEAEKPKQEPSSSAADLFKNIFSPTDTLINTPPPTKTDERKEFQPTEEKTRIPIADIMKEAHEKGKIDKETYDQAIQKIIKSNIEGGTLVGEFKVIQRDGKSEIILDEGEIEIPSGSKVEVIKKGGEISIIVKKTNETGIKGEIEKLEKLASDEAKEKVVGGEHKTEEGKRSESLDWLEGYEEDDSGGVTSEFKDEFDLTDLRKEFRLKKKKEGEETTEKTEGAEEETEPGIIDRLLKRIKKTTEESPQDKLKKLALENLSRMKGAEDERKAIVGVAYVLKQFLEIKFEITNELTYSELIRELRNRPMNNELRSRLIAFFKNTSLMVYANGPKADSFQKAYSLAEKTIKELS